MGDTSDFYEDIIGVLVMTESSDKWEELRKWVEDVNNKEYEDYCNDKIPEKHFIIRNNCYNGVLGKMKRLEVLEND